jgi:hypothetical protein
MRRSEPGLGVDAWRRLVCSSRRASAREDDCFIGLSAAFLMFRYCNAGAIRPVFRSPPRLVRARMPNASIASRNASSASAGIGACSVAVGASGPSCPRDQARTSRGKGLSRVAVRSPGSRRSPTWRAWRAWRAWRTGGLGGLGGGVVDVADCVGRVGGMVVQTWGAEKFGQRVSRRPLSERPGLARPSRGTLPEERSR